MTVVRLLTLERANEEIPSKDSWKTQLTKAADSNIRLILVLPYLNSSILTDGYDETVYPPLESVPKRFAISRRNEWMVCESDAVVAYVIRGFGGAAKTLDYARRKKKQIMLFQYHGDAGKPVAT